MLNRQISSERKQMPTHILNDILLGPRRPGPDQVQNRTRPGPDPGLDRVFFPPISSTLRVHGHIGTTA
jgi:hypothetical protein